MYKKLLVFGITACLLLVGLSGCLEPGAPSGPVAMIIISEIYYSTPDDLENEFIELYVWDDKDESVDITGWYITTFDGSNELLPYVSGLENFDYVYIGIGSGVEDLDASDGDAFIYLERSEAMLDDSGDEVGLYDANGRLIDFVRYNGGNGDPVLGSWDSNDPGASADSNIESIQIHGEDRNDSSNWISAPPSPANPNIDEWLMDSNLGLYYQIHNGLNKQIDVTGRPARRPDWNVINESGPLSEQEKNTIKEWLNHTYDYMKSRGLGTPEVATDGKVHVHITKNVSQAPSGSAGGTAWGDAGHIYVTLGNLSNRNDSIMAKQTIEHEHVHLIQHNNSNGYGRLSDWSDLEGMAEYWGTKIAMDNFDLTFDDYLKIHDEVYDRVSSGYDWYNWLKNTDRNYFENFVQHLDWYWANHMFLRWIEERYGEEKVRHIFRVRNATSGLQGIINVTKKAFEEQPLHSNITFEDLLDDFSVWLWTWYKDKITLASSNTFNGTINITEIGSLNPWGVDYEKITMSIDNNSKITFKGDSNKNYSITVIKKKVDQGIEITTYDYHRFKGSLNISLGNDNYIEIILIKRQLNCNTSTAYTLNMTTAANSPPYIPSNPNPSNSSTNISVETNRVSWTGGDPDPSDTVTYDVYFGTSSSPSMVVSSQSSLSYTPDSLEYSTKYYWKVVARDNHGSSAVGPLWWFTTEKANQAPIVYFSADPMNGSAPLEVNFTDESIDVDGEIVSYEWSFGDGNTSTLQNPTHVYYNAGSYLVILIITDDDGAVGIDSIDIDVE